MLINQTKKKCKTCKLVKSLDDFGKATSSRDGKRTECKLCHNARELVRKKDKMEEILCQHHKNCGGHCETDDEINHDLCSDCLEAHNTDWSSNVDRLIKLHQDMLIDNPHCYFELAYTRQTGWMAWICSAPKEINPDRKVIAHGQGDSAEIAAGNALLIFGTQA